MSTNNPVDPAEGRLFKAPSLRIVRSLLLVCLLVLILGVAAYLRFVGFDWDDGSHPHPDERFLTMVETGISLPSGIGEYFDTELSPLNPNNSGFSFFVYGTFPIFLVRYLAEWVSQTSYDQVHIVGRLASASFDVVSVFIVYLIGSTLYRRRVGLLAAAFAAFSVLTIQHAHFFVVDPFANTFILLGIYFAIRVYQGGRWGNYLLFGASLGLSTASKANAAPLALVLVIAVMIWVGRDEDQRRGERLIHGVLGLGLAAAVSLLVFRIFQPYAFEGPSFADVIPNDQFFRNLIEVRRQQSGVADFPPALQWAMRIPVLFTLRNMILWGLGVPLGIVSLIGFGWASIRMIRNREPKHALLVVWTGGYFLWQSSGFTQTMRYQIPIYPPLVILGAWGLWTFWDRASEIVPSRKRDIARALVGISILAVLVATSLWAFAFVNIYKQPHTQVDASRWIYRNVPGSFNLVMESSDGEYYQPGILPAKAVLHPQEDQALDLVFKADSGGQLSKFHMSVVQDSPAMGEDLILNFSLYEDLEATRLLGGFQFAGKLLAENLDIDINPSSAVDLSAGHEYLLRIEMMEGERVELNDQIWFRLRIEEAEKTIRISLPRSFALIEGKPYEGQLQKISAGKAVGVYLPYTSGIHTGSTPVHLQVDLVDPSADQPVLASAVYRAALSGNNEEEIRLDFDQPVSIEEGRTYKVVLHLIEGEGLVVRGSRIINESTWDLGLPFSVDGRSGFNGLYTGLNQELYWPDDEDGNNNGISDKLERIVRTLTQGDYLTIATNRQYGTIPRVPTRYPLTTAYYRGLFGCHWPDEVLECAAIAQPGEIQGEIGFELVSVHQSNPQLAGFEINDQLAEEAFTVYDHPKVLIFKKTSSFSPDLVWDLLGGVNLSNVEHASPKDLSAVPSNIQFVDEDFSGQKGGGTWSDLFNRNSLINRYPLLTIFVWWLAIGLLGLLLFPFTHIAFHGLYDGGYPFAKLIALLILSYGSWIAGNFGVSFERAEIFIILVFIVVTSCVIAWKDRDRLVSFFKRHRKTILWIEVLALGFFVFDLGIRLGNPDLWHPFKGGEKPMDFSYLNAVLKSRFFPPYDPWFAGGYINYYYYGFVLVGVPIKLLGIVPSAAYNLVIPTLFSMLAMGAYSVGYNLFLGIKRVKSEQWIRAARVAGFIAAIALIILGNFGTARLLYEQFQEIGDPGEIIQGGIIRGPLNALRGVAKVALGGEAVNISVDRWYWDPSRVIEPGPGEAGPITEFPFFTFLYADLHAHMINLPLTVAALGWAISWLYGAKDGWKERGINAFISLLLGSLVLGALRPTNTWDFPTYWTLAGLATLIVPFLERKKISFRNAFWAILSTGLLLGIAYLLFQPYNIWYQQEYTAAERWFGTQTTLNDYLTAHGAVLIVILTWFLWETREWMSITPITALRRYRRSILFLVTVGFIFILLVGILTFQGFGGAPVAFLVLFWSGLLFIRRQLAFPKRIVLFLIGTAAALTIFVEFVRLQGDVSRMNTVFKFYLQVWTLLSISAAVAGVWIYQQIHHWRKAWRNSWKVVIGLVIFLAALYPITATPAKISDRMSEEAPHSLDGMTFMETSSYYDISGPMPLDEDYRAIRWVQENVSRSPVIVEANTPEYRWGSRFTIYTGLPGVLGWNWHQRQQRGASAGSEVVERANEITSFYTDPSIDQALEFIDQYQVEYIVLGRLERQYYQSVQPCWPDPQSEGVLCDLRGRPMGMQDPEVRPSDCSPVNPQDEEGDLICPTFGLDKFETMEQMGELKAVYQDGLTVIYEVTQ